MEQFKMPPVLKNQDKAMRKAGFELEFANLPLKNAVKALQNEFDFSVEKQNEFLYHLHGKYGKYVLELDFELLTKQELNQKTKDFFAQVGIAIQEKHVQKLETLLGDLSEDIVPYELSTPPIPFDEVVWLDELNALLASSGALGTQVKTYYAFGLHINVELPDVKTETILDYLKAYLILEDFLNKDARLDMARKISPFIDSFPKKYTKLIVQSEYKPSQQELIRDYLYYNPSRNRSLDMLPLFAYLDKEQVRAVLPKEKIKPRPAFHYRLSNSKVGEVGWRVAHEWNRWVLVEELACDKKNLQELSKVYKEHLDNLVNLTTWEKKVRMWLEENSPA